MTTMPSIPVQAGTRSDAVPAYSAQQVQALELLAAAAYNEEAIAEVIRPSAVLPESAARAVLSELGMSDARTGGEWIAEPPRWRRYDRPSDDLDGGSGNAQLMGTTQVAYGTPTRYEITVFRATITQLGAASEWTVAALCDDAFRHGGLTLDRCPRVDLKAPPRPFPMREAPAVSARTRDHRWGAAA
ncbi:MAG: hypothetical protein NVSMB55_21380 [Mycobacteriales bacterium]